MTNINQWQNIPLPKRIWWLWDDPIDTVGFFTTFSLESATNAELSLACSGSYRAWVDGASLPTIEAPYPSWRVMHRIPVDLSYGEHTLCIEANLDGQNQPSLLACLDWQKDGSLVRIASGKDWQMTAKPTPGWQFTP